MEQKEEKTKKEKKIKEPKIKNEKVKTQKPKKKVDKSKILVRIMAVILAVLMVFSIAATLIFYLV